MHWLADGFHRYYALIGVNAKAVNCTIFSGELRDAILYACGANAAHGLRRPNADKRQAVSKLVTDNQWGKWSDREIARRCHVSEHTVAKLRKELTPITAQIRSEERTYRTKHGTVGTMKTGKIGKGRALLPPRHPPRRCGTTK